MSNKTFCLLTITGIFFFIVFNFLIFKLRTELLLTNASDGGDLARTAYVVESKFLRKNHIDLPRRHFIVDFNNNQYKKTDILTMGDSFSFGMGEGRNHFYQDYIATACNARVANLFPYPTEDAVKYFSPLSNLLQLYNSGLLDEIKPKYVLIESVERYCIQRYSHPYDFTMTAPKEKLVKTFTNRKYTFDYLPPVSFMNSGNFKYLYYSFRYRFSDKAVDKSSSVVYRKLTRPLFSANDDHILFLYEDVVNAQLVNDQSVAALNDNLNKTAELLAKKHIKLIFMPIVDKYDLYSDYIADNPYPKSRFFETLRPLPKRYLFIDTKRILKEEVDKGVRDIFYPDESHWSYKAPEKIFASFQAGRELKGGAERRIVSWRPSPASLRSPPAK